MISIFNHQQASINKFPEACELQGSVSSSLALVTPDHDCGKRIPELEQRSISFVF